MHDQVEVKPPFRAILFDCNGIISDDEPLHLKLFQKVLREEGIPLTRREYFERYLAMDDRSCFRDVLRRHRRPWGDRAVQKLIRRKAAYYAKAVQRGVRIFPGVRSFVKAHRADHVLAVISGALRREILWILNHAGIRSAFSAIVSAEDVRCGKPDPECYRKGLRALNRLPAFRERPLQAAECLAIEDSVHGVRAARRAGMRCIAVTNSYPARELRHADRVVRSLAGLRLSEVPFRR